MKISIFPRTAGKKSDPKKNRREGQIPGVVYGLNRTPQNIYVKLDEVQTILRNMKQGLLPTTLFDLHEGDKKTQALIKEIQYQHATYAILHIDFMVVSDTEPVTVKVPIQIAGVAECVGIKLGGFLRQVIRFLKVSCLPKDIPQELMIDIRELDVMHSKTLGAIAIPAGVRPLAKLSEVAVVIAKKV